MNTRFFLPSEFIAAADILERLADECQLKYSCSAKTMRECADEIGIAVSEFYNIMYKDVQPGARKAAKILRWLSS